MSHRCCVLAIAALMAGGCAMQSQVVRLNPTLDKPPASVSNAGTVALRVTDERPSKDIGRRSTGAGTGLTIATDQDLAEVIQSKVSEALVSRGFKPAPFGEAAPRSMSIGLQLLEYDTVGSTVTIKAVLTSSLVHGPHKLEQTYRAQREQKVFITPIAKTNEEWINEVFSDVLNKLCSDSKLLAFLSE